MGFISIPRSLMRRLLFVLDLNGTLMERLTRSTEKQAFKLNPHHDGSKTSVTVNGTPMIIRPHLDRFLDCLYEYGEVAVWTSMTDRNATAICKILFANRHLQFIWTQDHCDLVHTPNQAGFVKPLMRKPLDKIWSQFHGLYDQHNTIIIDDSKNKILESHSANHLHIGEFDIYKSDYLGDRVLAEVADGIDAFMQRDSKVVASDLVEYVRSRIPVSNKW